MSGTIEAGAGLSEAGARLFTGAAIDSRQVAGGDLFFALGGSRTDGHRFVAPALAAGAAAAVVDERGFGLPEGALLTGGALIRVADAYAALHDLTRQVRGQVPEKLVGLTGSVGKTTTKELLAAMLGRRFRVAKSPGNLNNRLGFPLALLGIADDSEWMVAEMGMSVPGELAEVSRLARPDVALLLNVRPVHLENFDSLSAIAEAKAEILAGLPAHGLLVANADDPEVARVASRHPGRIAWFGHGPLAGPERAVGLGQSETRASEIEALGGGRTGSRFLLTVRREDDRVESRAIELALHGLYNVDNCLAAAACALMLGASLDDVAAAAAAASPASGRGVLHALPGGGTLIDDSYNSNPVALARALESAAQSPARRKWAVLGDMLELGPEAPRFHREAGAEATRHGFSPIAGVGELSRELVAGAREAGAPALWFATAAEAAEWAAAELRLGDLVLVKGSRGVGLDAVVERLLAEGRA